MIKCDGCGKTTILPEKLGEANICKICFVKINGPVWKYLTVENSKDLENHKNRALEKARINNFSDTAIKGIEDYFNSKQGDMTKCDACGELMHTIHKMGNSNICKKCYSKIDTKEWRNKNYYSRNQLETEKDKVVIIAKSFLFPEDAINYIKETFDNKIPKDWICTIDGKRDQILTVYNDYFTINTTEDFDIDDVAEDYAEVYNEDHLTISKSKDKEISTKAVVKGTTGIAKDLLTATVSKKGRSKSIKNISKSISKGIGSAFDSILDELDDEEKIERKAFKAVKGTRKYQYTDFDIVKFREVGQDSIGYLKFQNKNQSSSNDILFFYDSTVNKDVKNAISYVYDYMFKKLGKKEEKEKEKEPVVQKTTNSQIADDIKKFKELLDCGAITQEEYDKKKKEILNL